MRAIVFVPHCWSSSIRTPQAGRGCCSCWTPSFPFLPLSSLSFPSFLSLCFLFLRVFILPFRFLSFPSLPVPYLLFSSLRFPSLPFSLPVPSRFVVPSLPLLLLPFICSFPSFRYSFTLIYQLYTVYIICT